VSCIKSLPHLVEMQRKYGPEGLVVISVHLNMEDDEKEERAKVAEKALKWLRRVNPNFTTLMLDEPNKVWAGEEGKLGEYGTPIVYLFNRDNQIEAKYTDADKAHAGLEKLLPELLKK